MADMYLGDSAGAADRSVPGAVSVISSWLGALMSVALIAGLAVWGYQLMMREVTGVPVVRALAGPMREALKYPCGKRRAKDSASGFAMREAPKNPCGKRVEHQGLAVNSVVAEGSAKASAVRLILASKPLDLSDEDLSRAQLAGAEPVPAVEPAPEAGVDVPALAGTVTENVTLPGASPLPTRLVSASVPGVARSPLPRPRPIGDIMAEAVALSVAGPAIEVDAASLPVGTRLVQFGAFDSAGAARAEWVRLDGRFTDFLNDKKRVIEKAVSGGKTFFRLRALGFVDINDARRFCSALLAEKQACIPVVTR